MAHKVPRKDPRNAAEVKRVAAIRSMFPEGRNVKLQSHSRLRELVCCHVSARLLDHQEPTVKCGDILHESISQGSHHQHTRPTVETSLAFVSSGAECVILCRNKHVEKRLSMQRTKAGRSILPLLPTPTESGFTSRSL